MRAVVAEREMRALGINFVFLLRTLVTVHRGNCSFSKLPRSWADDTGEIEASWRRTEQALRATVHFVRHEMGWTTRRWLPSTMALIPVVYLLAASGSSTLRGKDAELVKRYLLISGLRSLFRGSGETVVNTYVNSVRSARDGRTPLARALFGRIPKNRLYKIKKDDVRATSGLYSSLMQIFSSRGLTGEMVSLSAASEREPRANTIRSTAGGTRQKAENGTTHAPVRALRAIRTSVKERGNGCQYDDPETGKQQ